MLALAGKARSSQILTAAHCLTLGWLASLAAWRWVDAGMRELAYAGVDLSLAGSFFLMTRGRWFPAPLFLLHAALVVYDFYALCIGSPTLWVSAFLNRAFELALAYVAGCALYRLHILAKRQKGALS